MKTAVGLIEKHPETTDAGGEIKKKEVGVTVSQISVQALQTCTPAPLAYFCGH